MKDLLEKWIGSLTEEARRCLKFLAIPVVVLVLIVVVVVLDRPKGGEQRESVSTPAQAVSEAEEPAKAEVVLEEEAIPEIHELMERYFAARKICDLEKISNVYGNTYSQEELQAQGAHLEEEVKFYQNFENLVCYTYPGLSEGEYVVYARFDVKFRQAATLAPSLIVCYAKTGADGKYYLEAVPDGEQSGYMERVNLSPQVQAIAKEVNSALEEALKADDNLLAVYRILREEGRTVSDPEETPAAPEQETEGESE